MKQKGLYVEDMERIKFVPAAQQWCKTVIKDGKQTQTWHSSKKEAEDAESDL